MYFALTSQLPIGREKMDNQPKKKEYKVYVEIDGVLEYSVLAEDEDKAKELVEQKTYRLSSDFGDTSNMEVWWQVNPSGDIIVEEVSHESITE